MRISSKMGYGAFTNNLSRLTEAQYFDTLRQSTGKDIQSIAEAPTRLMDVKKIINQKTMKENFIERNSYATSEMRAAEDAASAISEAMQQIKDLSVQSLNVAYDGNVASVGTFIKGILTDMIRNANADFNGKYMFAGTKTTPNSIQGDYPDMNNMPFELVEGEATADNPSGLSVVFKGNTDDRTINKDGHSTEVISMNPAELFGPGATSFFDPIIKVYNILQYTSEGVPRDSYDTMNTEEKYAIGQEQSVVAYNIDYLNKTTANLSARRLRIETVNDQMTEEITRLNEIKSLNEDADMSKVLSRLAQENTSLQYTLSAGAKIQEFSLFKFI
ncbi:MAG: hypothetical protein LBO69_07245 [Ignavibacteria bacterium]|jgi:flagellin-like hook-associated protein FlgL|nr:hypothetical protein [Ignavibacteria bacterium]